MAEEMIAPEAEGTEPIAVSTSFGTISECADTRAVKSTPAPPAMPAETTTQRNCRVWGGGHGAHRGLVVLRHHLRVRKIVISKKDTSVLPLYQLKTKTRRRWKKSNWELLGKKGTTHPIESTPYAVALRTTMQSRVCSIPSGRYFIPINPSSTS